jgi:hypothetical protein
MDKRIGPSLHLDTKELSAIWRSGWVGWLGHTFSSEVSLQRWRHPAVHQLRRWQKRNLWVVTKENAAPQMSAGGMTNHLSPAIIMK